MSKDQYVEIKCVYCGIPTNADNDHFHGRVSSICNRYGTCGRNFQSFKNKLKNNKKSKYKNQREFAIISEVAVIVNGEPAIWWDKQLTLVRKRVKIDKKHRIEKLLLPIINS